MVRRADLVFFDVIIEGALAKGFDIYRAAVEQKGERLIVTLTESASGLNTILNCSKAIVRQVA